MYLPNSKKGTISLVQIKSNVKGTSANYKNVTDSNNVPANVNLKISRGF